MTAQNEMNILKLRVNRNLPVEVTVSTVRFKCLKFLANNAPKWRLRWMQSTVKLTVKKDLITA